MASAPGGFSPQGQLSYHNGPLLTNVQVFTIFWGAAWQQSPQSGLVVQLNQFFDFILTSSLIDLLGEYSVPGKAIGHGSRIGTATITSSEPGNLVAGGREVTDGQIQTALQTWITANTIPQATANTLYFVFLPPGVTSVLGGDRSCQVFCGYHSHVGTSLFYAVEPFITCAGCTFGQTLDSLTKVSSHELCEAITDPALNAWFDNTTGNEIGDICNQSVQKLGPYTVQLEWSNANNACLLGPPHAWRWADQGTPPGKTVTGRVGSITVMDNPNSSQRPYAFVKASDSHLWVDWWDGSAWHWADQGTPPGKTITGGVGAITVMDNPNASQRPYAFVQASDGHLWVNWWDGNAWHWADQGTPPGKTVTGKVGTITVKDNPNSSQRPYAFVKASDSHLWVNWWDGNAWHWADQGTPPGKTISAGIGAITVMDNPNASQRPYAFVQASDGHLWVNWWDGNAWHWADQGTPPGKTISAGVGAITVMDNPNSSQRPYAFVQASDGHLWVNWWNGNAWHWADQGTPPGKTVNAGIGVTTVMDNSSASQRPYAFVQASDGHLWVNWWNGSAWQWADQGTPPGKTVSAGIGAITVKDNPNSSQRPYAFVQASDGHLWVDWWS
jgi:hypothetical protein